MILLINLIRVSRYVEYHARPEYLDTPAIRDTPEYRSGAYRWVTALRASSWKKKIAFFQKKILSSDGRGENITHKNNICILGEKHLPAEEEDAPRLNEYISSSRCFRYGKQPEQDSHGSPQARQVLTLARHQSQRAQG